jgi:hypothetical protein
MWETDPCAAAKLELSSGIHSAVTVRCIKYTHRDTYIDTEFVHVKYKHIYICVLFIYM